MKTKRIISGLLSVLLCLSLVIGMVPLIPAVSAAGPEDVTGKGSCSEHKHDDGTWTAIEADTVLTNEMLGGTAKIYLKGDVYIKSRITIYPSGSPHICLNGHKIIVDGANTSDADYAILLQGKMTLCDCNGNGQLTITNPQKHQGLIQLLQYVGSAVYPQLDIHGGTITGNVTTSHGGGIRVGAANAVVNMHGGVISGNKTSHYTTKGAGVYINAGTFNMIGGKISGNTSQARSGAGVYVNGGTFNMTGGYISGNNTVAATSDTAGNVGGAGVYVETGKFTLNGGTISGNIAGGINNYGAGVYVAGGTFEMKNGAISNNSFTATGSGYGGAIYAAAGSTVTISNGDIKDNRAHNGAGIYIPAGATVTMANGNITGNIAANDGGAIYSLGNFVMTNGEISGNSATNCGGIKVETAEGSFTMSGGNIFGNTGGSNVPDVRLNMSSTGTVSGNAVVEDIDIVKNASLTIKNLKPNASINARDYSADVDIVTDKTAHVVGSVYTYNLGLDTQARMVLGSSLNIQFKLPDALADETVTVEGGVTYEQDGQIITVYRNPAQMAEDITLNIGAYTYTDSVQKYAERLIAKEGTTEVLKNVLIDMLNYGDAAQKAYLNYGPAMTLGDYADDSDTTLPDDYYKNAEGQARLILSDGIAMRVKVENAAVGTAATYAFTSFDDEEYTVNTTVQQESDGTCYVLVDRICMADAFNKVTVTVGEETIEDSVAAYCDRQKDETLVNLCDALLKFAAAAQAYLPTVS